MWSIFRTGEIYRFARMSILIQLRVFWISLSLSHIICLFLVRTDYRPFWRLSSGFSDCRITWLIRADIASVPRAPCTVPTTYTQFIKEAAPVIDKRLDVWASGLRQEHIFLKLFWAPFSNVKSATAVHNVAGVCGSIGYIRDIHIRDGGGSGRELCVYVPTPIERHSYFKIYV